MAVRNDKCEEENLSIPILMMSLRDSELISKVLVETNGINMTIRVNGTNTECAICQEEMVEGDNVIKLPRCGHPYHERCVLSWLEKHHTCPLCRLAMPTIEASRVEASRATQGVEDVHYT